MSAGLSFRAAAEMPIVELAALYTRCFAGYPYPVYVAPAALARRVRAEQIDLGRSPLICVGGAPAGLALLGLRGAEANCAGFGIAPELRGRGLAGLLLDEHLRLARDAGARRMTLMVLAENLGALRLYLRAGMRVTRDLLWLGWRAAPGGRPSAAPELVRVEPGGLLDRPDQLPRATAFWQRDLPTLRALDGLEGWELPGAPGRRACALADPTPGGGAQLLDLAAAGSGDAARLLAGLQARYSALSVNEPADSPMVPALRAAGFAQEYLRHELELAL